MAQEDDVITSPRLPERGPTEREKRVFDETAAAVLARRVAAAQRDGAVNIAVKISFLLELLEASRVAMRHANYTSREEI